MQLRLVPFPCGRSLIRWICAISVALAGILHVDATFGSAPAGSGPVLSSPQDHDRPADHQAASERCHACSVTAFASVVATMAREPGNPVVPCGRASPLVSVEHRATAPPPRA